MFGAFLAELTAVLLSRPTIQRPITKTATANSIFGPQSTMNVLSQGGNASRISMELASLRRLLASKGRFANNT